MGEEGLVIGGIYYRVQAVREPRVLAGGLPSQGHEIFDAHT